MTHEDTALYIAQGGIRGYSGNSKFGRNPVVAASATPEDVHDGALGTWVAPTAPRIHQFVSTSTDDAAAGTGARTVRFYGLPDWDTPEESAVITMNGTTDVPTLRAYAIIHRIECLTWGAAGPNVGVITATADDDATETARISAGVGKTLMAVYGFPSTRTAMLTRANGWVNRAQAASVNFTLLFNPIPDQVTTKYRVELTGAAHSQGPPFDKEWNPYKKLVGPGIVKWEADVSANSTDVSLVFDMILIDN